MKPLCPGAEAFDWTVIPPAPMDRGLYYSTKWFQAVALTVT